MPYPKNKPVKIQRYYSEKDKQEKQCIVEVLWFETRGESLQGIKDVLSVVYNRTKHEKFPSTFCGVVHAKKQFSYRNAYKQGTKVRIQVKHVEQQVKHQIDMLADAVIMGKFKPTLPANVLYYHTTKVKPSWAKVKPVVLVRDNHVFRAETS